MSRGSRGAGGGGAAGRLAQASNKAAANKNRNHLMQRFDDDNEDVKSGIREILLRLEPLVGESSCCRFYYMNVTNQSLFAE